MVWAMIEETWTVPGEPSDRPDRSGAVGPRGPDHWGLRVLRALAAAYNLDGAPLGPLVAVRPTHLPSPIPDARPSSME
eukprot:13386227-Alexandrium_andersonii.AAC.1